MVIALLLLISSIPVSAKNLSKYQTVKTKEKTLSTGIVEKIDVNITKRVIDSVTAPYTIPEEYK